MISNILNFETDNSKFYDDQEDEILEVLGNTKPFDKKVKKQKIINLNFDEPPSYDEIIETVYYQLEYNNNIIKFANRNELASFVNEKTEYNEPYYILNIPKKSHCVEVKMRNLESICEYLIKFHKFI